MSKRLIIPFLALFATSPFAQDLTPYTDQKLMGKSKSKMYHQHNQVCDNRQYSYRASGSGISPDFFLLVNGMVHNYIATELRYKDCSNVDKPIGSPDRLIHAEMTAEGIKLTFTNNSNGNRQAKSMLWSDFNTYDLPF